MQQNSNQRIIYLDLLRILATFAVIFVHVCASDFYSLSFSSEWYTVLIYDGLVRWCIPVFVMISGTLFLNPMKEVNSKSIITYYIPRLLLAYIIWTVVYYFLFYYNGNFCFRRLLESYLHLWFLPMLMGVYLFIPVLRKIAVDNKLMCYFLMVWGIYVFISFFSFVSTFKYATHFYSYFTMKSNSIFGFSGYFLLGFFLHQYTFSRKQKSWIYVIGIIVVLITICGTLYMSIKKQEPDERFFSYLSINVAVMAISFFVFVKENALKCGKSVRRFVDFVRKDLFGVYLSHMIWCNFINTEAFRHCCSEIITLPLITIIVFILSLFTTKLIRLVPYLRKVVE